MTALSQASSAALARLRAYVPPPTAWHSLPLSRRAAVLILLFADRKGELRVVLTMRAATLKSFAGQAALPGGKSDTMTESPLQTARREAFEEIGLPLPSTSSSSIAQPSASDTKYNPPTPSLPYPFQLDHLCQLPTHLAKTELGVRPCVAFLSANNTKDRYGRTTEAETMLIPRLDAKEVAAVFSAPLHNFLRKEDEISQVVEEDNRSLRQAAGYGNELVEDDGKWYEGTWIPWYNTRFKMHNFYVPIHGQNVTYSRLGRSQQDGEYPAERGGSTIPYSNISSNREENPLQKLSRFRVWGMTARILVDCARVAYGEEPEFEFNHHHGDEQLIGRLLLKWEGQMRKSQKEAEEEQHPGDWDRALDIGKRSGSRKGRL